MYFKDNQKLFQARPINLSNNFSIKFLDVVCYDKKNFALSSTYKSNQIYKNILFFCSCCFFS